MAKRLIEDDEFMMLPEMAPRAPRPISVPATTVHSLYLSGEILSPQYYIEWFNLIRRAPATDVIVIHINSPGGTAATCIQMMRAMAESEAQIIASVEGDCMSAATMIALSCDAIEIADHAMFMFHNYSGMVAGKGGEMVEQLNHMQKWSENLLRTVYEDFFTDVEIKQMLENKDIWMDADEVRKRIQKKIKTAKKKQKLLQKEMKAILEETADDQTDEE